MTFEEFEEYEKAKRAFLYYFEHLWVPISDEKFWKAQIVIDKFFKQYLNAMDNHCNILFKELLVRKCKDELEKLSCRIELRD